MSEHEIQRFLLYVGASIAYAAFSYISKVLSDDDVHFDPVKMGKTVVVGAVAGGIMVSGGDEWSVEAYGAAAAIAIPVVDTMLNRAVDSMSRSESA